MEKIQLGAAGPTVGRYGLGCMGMSDFYGPADRGESIATIHAAVEAGVTLIDTGDFYGMGHNELLIAEAMKGIARDKVQLSVKFGAQRGPDSSWIGFDTRPAAVKTALAYTLKRLNVDHIDIYRPARLDPAVPIEDTVGAIADCIRGAMSAISASPKSARKRSGARTRCSPSSICRSNMRSSPAASKTRSSPRSTSSASA